MMINRRLIFILLISSLFILLLNGCGFHLKGSTKNSIQPMFLVIDYGDVSAGFRQVFQQQLAENDHFLVTHVPDNMARGKEAKYAQLVFKSDSCKRRSLSVSRSGVPVEYRVSCQLSFQFVEPNKISVDRTNIKSDEIIESRDFQSNDGQLLAFDSQQSLIKQEIKKTIAERVLQQLQ